jgi:hypothetical protein
MRTTYMFGLFALTGAIAIATGCGDDTTITPGTGGSGGATGPGPTTSTGGTGPTTTTGGGGSVPDESTSCDDALTMDERMNADNLPFYDNEGFLTTDSDKDYVKFTATAGDWIGMFTVANDGTTENSTDSDDSTVIDTVITLFDEAGNTMLAQNDDAYPRATTDSEMFFHVITTGTYCLEVQEWGTWQMASVDKAGQYYRTIVLPVDFGVYEQYNEDTGSDNNSAVDAQTLSVTALTNGQDFSMIAGVLDPGTDVDWYEVIAPTAALGFSMDLTPMGNDGFGSTQGPGNIDLLAADGTTVIARSDNTEQTNGLTGMSSVPVTENLTYFLRVQRPMGNTTVGVNDFYFLKMFTQDTLNTQEVIADNATQGTAEQAIPTANPQAMDQTFRSWFVGGTLSDINDVDYFELVLDGVNNIPAPVNGEEMTVACSSWAAGSRVRSFTVTFEDESNTTSSKIYLEDKAKGIVGTNNTMNTNSTDTGIALQGSGAFFLAVSAGSVALDTGVTSAHYLCGFHVGAAVAP